MKKLLIAKVLILLSIFSLKGQIKLGFGLNLASYSQKNAFTTNCGTNLEFKFGYQVKNFSIMSGFSHIGRYYENDNGKFVLYDYKIPLYFEHQIILNNNTGISGELFPYFTIPHKIKTESTNLPTTDLRYGFGLNLNFLTKLTSTGYFYFGINTSLDLYSKSDILFREVGISVGLYGLLNKK